MVEDNELIIAYLKTQTILEKKDKNPQKPMFSLQVQVVQRTYVRSTHSLQKYVRYIVRYRVTLLVKVGKGR